MCPASTGSKHSPRLPKRSTRALNSSLFRSSVRILVVGLALWLAAAPAASAQDARAADWLRTVRDTPLWSGAADPAVQFTMLPLGSFVQPRAGTESGRVLIYYP